MLFLDGNAITFVASLLKVDRLILASNTFGIYDHQKQTIENVENIANVRQFITEEKSSQGTGGMHSKLDAAAIAQSAGIETWIINGHEDNFLLKAINKEVKFTRII